MDKQKLLIGETSFVSIGIVAMMIIGAFRFGQLADGIQANARNIEESQALKHQMLVELRDMNQRLSRIEGFLKKDGFNAR